MNYINNVDQLINFHPEVNKNLLNSKPTEDIGEFMNKFSRTKELILGANED